MTANALKTNLNQLIGSKSKNTVVRTEPNPEKTMIFHGVSNHPQRAVKSGKDRPAGSNHSWMRTI